MTASRSRAFALFHEAILGRRPIRCRYKGLARDICPHILGHSGEQEKALVYQYAGESASGLPAGGEWRCLDLAEVSDIRLHPAGRWHSGHSHRRPQHCVERVFVDVNEAVPDQPGRRGRP
jgi:hypothetical protein